VASVQSAAEMQFIRALMWADGVRSTFLGNFFFFLIDLII